MSGEETIVAIATPLGEGGLGVVRLSGPESLAIADRIFQFDGHLASVPSHTLHHGWIRSGDEMIDEAVTSVFRRPRSYTGEDIVEISSHGSPAVLKKIVHLCEQAGARLALPGEFTQRAFLNGKMDLLQAEAVAELIGARSEKARRAAALQLRGALSDRLRPLRQRLVDLLAHIEANLDFVEEDIPPVSRQKILAGLQEVEETLSALLSTSLRGRWWREGVKVAFAGKPNVGKSSLFNALLSEDRAIVTEVPGTTRDTLEEQVQWDGVLFVLTDTAGLRPTAEPVEVHGTERARRAQSAADIVLLVVDGSRPLENEDKAILEDLNGRRLVVAVNKSDQGRQVNSREFLPFGGMAAIATSAKKNHGLSELKNALMRSVGADARETEDAPVISSLRHIRHLERCVEKIKGALVSIEAGRSEESFAVDIRAALEEINALTGENVTEDVLSSIFSQFCVGK